MSDFASVMWTTIKVVVVLLAGFAAIVYLGNQAGILAGPSASKTFETCLLAHGAPNEAKLRVGLEYWREYDERLNPAHVAKREHQRSVFFWDSEEVRKYWAWIGFNPNYELQMFFDRDEIHNEESIQAFLNHRRAEVMPYCQ